MAYLIIEDGRTVARIVNLKEARRVAHRMTNHGRSVQVIGSVAAYVYFTSAPPQRATPAQPNLQPNYTPAQQEIVNEIAKLEQEDTSNILIVAALKGLHERLKRTT